MNLAVKQEDLLSSEVFKNIPLYIRELFSGTLYPWEALPRLNEYIRVIISKIDTSDFAEYLDGVWIGKGSQVADSAVICAPCIIGKECEIRPGAYIRGNVITGSGCVIGNSTEIKNSVIFDHVQLPHYNYVGDSIIGNYSHMGAGAVCSNQKQDKSEITVKCAGTISSGLRKFGAILSDNVEIGCGCVLNPGTVVLNNTRIYPLTSVRGAIPADSIMKSKDEITIIKNAKLP